jgi:hypothetical protein
MGQEDRTGHPDNARGEPEPGDVSICLYCSVVSRFVALPFGGLGFEVVDPADPLLSDPRIVTSQDAVRRYRELYGR